MYKMKFVNLLICQLTLSQQKVASERLSAVSRCYGTAVILLLKCRIVVLGPHVNISLPLSGTWSPKSVSLLIYAWLFLFESSITPCSFTALPIILCFMFWTWFNLSATAIFSFAVLCIIANPVTCAVCVLCSLGITQRYCNGLWRWWFFSWFWCVFWWTFSINCDIFDVDVAKGACTCFRLHFSGFNSNGRLAFIVLRLVVAVRI